MVDVGPDLEGGFERVGGVQVVTAASVVVGGRDAVVVQSDRVTNLDLKLRELYDKKNINAINKITITT